MAPRSWDWWTEQKLDLLGDYLSAFTKASKKAGQTIYLDLFAGQPDNISRDPQPRVIRGSALRALDTRPPLSLLRLFELAANARKLEQDITADYTIGVQGLAFGAHIRRIRRRRSRIQKSHSVPKLAPRTAVTGRRSPF